MKSGSARPEDASLTQSVRKKLQPEKNSSGAGRPEREGGKVDGKRRRVAQRWDLGVKGLLSGAKQRGAPFDFRLT
jgi:hypothetical protein